MKKYIVTLIFLVSLSLQGMQTIEKVQQAGENSDEPSLVEKMLDLKVICEHEPIDTDNLPNYYKLKVTLQKISFRNKEITDISKYVDRLHSLSNQVLTQEMSDRRSLLMITMLSLSQNKLTDLPGSLSKLNNLRHLWLTDNKFTQIPTVIGFFKSTLKGLYMSKNQITSFEKIGSESIADFSNLKVVDFSENPIKTLPEQEILAMHKKQVELGRAFRVGVTGEFEASPELLAIKDVIVNGKLIEKKENPALEDTPKSFEQIREEPAEQTPQVVENRSLLKKIFGRK